MKTALTIAGSDSCGGAGIQADIKTMTAHGVYAMSAITALTAQNTTGVRGILAVEADFLEKQIAAVAEDIVPDAVKTGMIPSESLILATCDGIKKFALANVVVDPVMVATSGARLIDESAVGALRDSLLPLALVATPNIPEAEVLADITIASEADMEKAAEIMFRRYGCAVLVKGGHRVNDANDFLFSRGGRTWFYGSHVENPNTHGTGCTLSSAIAANLAKGLPLEQAVEKAKRYVSSCLSAQLDLGTGNGPMNHAFAIEGDY